MPADDDAALLRRGGLGPADSARLPRKRVALFVSSSFSDTAPDRSGLWRDALLPLSRWCRRRGLAFEAVDLRSALSAPLRATCPLYLLTPPLPRPPHPLLAGASLKRPSATARPSTSASTRSAAAARSLWARSFSSSSPTSTASRCRPPPSRTASMSSSSPRRPTATAPSSIAATSATATTSRTRSTTSSRPRPSPSATMPPSCRPSPASRRAPA